MLRQLKYDVINLFEELWLLAQHPTRKASRDGVSYHWYKCWDHVLFHPWYCLKRGVRNIFIWFPLIWRNDVFDHCYLLDLIDKQLSEMETFWYSDNPHVMKQEQVAKRITWTRKLMKMHRDDYYSMKWYEEHAKKYEKTGLIKSEPHTTDEYGVVTSYICKPMGVEEREHYYSGSNKAQEMDEKVYKLFIKNISMLRNWWD